MIAGKWMGFLGFACSLAALAGAPSAIVGTWHYETMTYRGAEMPPRDTRLELRFTFSEDGHDALYWTRDGGATFCARDGEYQWQDGMLSDHVTRIDPRNRADCGADPDMQLGRVTQTPVEVIGDQLRLRLPLADEEVIYVFRRAASAR